MDRQANIQVIRESFGRVVYTHKTHEKAREIATDNAARIKRWNVILTALTATSVLATLIADQNMLKLVTAILSAVALGFSVYQLSFNPEKEAQLHRQTAKELIGIRDRYIHLLVDIKGGLPDDEILKRRDRLVEDTKRLYDFAPDTTYKAYKKAQEALQVNQDFTFSNEELNKFLPDTLHIDD